MYSNAVQETPMTLVKRFRRECGLKERTARNYSLGAAKLAEHLELCNMSVVDIDLNLILNLRLKLSAKYTKDTLLGYLVGIRAFVFWLVDEGFVKRATADEIYRHFRCSPRKIETGCGVIEPELVEIYISTFTNVMENTRKSYATEIRCFSRYLESHGVTLDDADESTLDEFAAWLRKNRTDNVARKVLSRIKDFYRWLDKQGIHDDVSKNASIGKKKKGYSKAPLTPESARLVLKAAEACENREQGLRNRLVIELALVCAMKPGEISALNVSNVVFIGNKAAISVPAGKRRLESLVYVPKGTARLMKLYLDERKAKPTDPLIVSILSRRNHERKRLTSNSVGQLIGRAFSKAGIEGKACSWSLMRTSLEIAVSLGANEEELRRFGRFRSAIPLGNIAHSCRGEGLVLQDGIEDLLSLLEPKAAVRVISVGEILSSIAGLGAETLVSVTIDDEKGLAIEPIIFL